MTERKNIAREVTSIYLDGETLDEAIKGLQRLADVHGGAAVIRKTTMPYEDYEYLALFVSEPETDQEFQERLTREDKDRRRREEYDAAEFKRLSAKFAKAEHKS